MQDILVIPLQTGALLIPVIVAVLGYWFTKRNQLELTRWREHLDLINSRLNDFYGPLYVQSEVGYMAYKTLVDKMGGEEVFRQVPIAARRAGGMAGLGRNHLSTAQPGK